MIYFTTITLNASIVGKFEFKDATGSWGSFSHAGATLSNLMKMNIKGNGLELRNQPLTNAPRFDGRFISLSNFNHSHFSLQGLCQKD